MKPSTVLGLLATIFGGKILWDAFSGTPANSMSELSGLFGGQKKEALLFSYVLGAIGLWFGLRALFFGAVCLGDECNVDDSRWY